MTKARMPVPVLVQAQIFEAVVSHDLLTGTIHALAQRFGVTPAESRACLAGLVHAGWVTLSTDPGDLYRVRLEQ